MKAKTRGQPRKEIKVARPLEGVRILEWAVFHNGPAAGYMLGDLGAEVIKIEEPVRGDPIRGMESLFGSVMSLPGGRNIGFETANRSKKGITLDLKKEEGRQVLCRLVKKADVFYTNFRREVARDLGADYDTLKKHNPGLIYAVNSGLGTRGPEAHKRSFDTIAQARSGIMWAVGDRDHTEPFQLVGAILDQMGATMFAYGILAALLCRERTGIGQEIEVSLLGSALHLQALNINTALLRQWPQARHSRTRARNPLANHYRCTDGKWLMLAEPQSDRFWSPFCQAIDRPELEKDPRFENALKRRDNCQELIRILDTVFSTRIREDWLKTLEEKAGGLAFAPIVELSEVADDPQVQANEYIVGYDHPTLGKIKLLGCPVRFSQTPAGIAGPAPEFGQHTEEVLLEIGGYSWEEVAQLREKGAI